MQCLPASLSFALFVAIGGFSLPTMASAQSANKKPVANYKIFFDLKDANVSKEALAIIDVAAADFKSKAASLIEVEGNTDTSADEAANKKLARTRADAVRDALNAKGVPAAAISAIAVGSTRPLVPTPKGTKEPLNRRVEITLYVASNVPVPANAKRAAPECLLVPRPGERPVMRNTCNHAINVQIFDLDKKVIVERRLNPKEEMPVLSGFGAVCPADHHSDTAFTPENEVVFMKDAYHCIRK